jgi:hypothetical protein
MHWPSTVKEIWKVPFIEFNEIITCCLFHLSNCWGHWRKKNLQANLCRLAFGATIYNL